MPHRRRRKQRESSVIRAGKNLVVETTKLE